LAIILNQKTSGNTITTTVNRYCYRDKSKIDGDRTGQGI